MSILALEGLLAFIFTVDIIQCQECNYDRIYPGCRDQAVRVVGLDARILDSDNFPYIVSLQLVHSEPVNPEDEGCFRHFCGGTMIAPNFVLTAAHCFDKIQLGGPERNQPIQKIYVANNPQCRHQRNPNLERIPVKSVFIHDQYDESSFEYDVAVVELDGSYEGDVVEVYDGNQDLSELGEVEVMGYGLTGVEEDGKYVVYPLNGAKLVPINKSECGNLLHIYGLSEENLRYDSMFCAYNKRADACAGDSGGPLIYSGKQIGIVSWGPNIDCSIMNQGQSPGVYARVSAFAQWIKQTVQQNTTRVGGKLEFGSIKWSDNLRNNHDIIYLKDVNGDGKDDFVAFSEDGVLVALSTGTQFLEPELWTSQFGSTDEAGGWAPVKNHRYLEDLNGDGLVDIIGFLDGTYVSLNTGSSFQPMQLWTHDFGNSLEWNNETEFPHFLVDMNNDGLKDLVGFKVYHVWVSLSNGSAFQTAKNWSGEFGTKQGYDKTIYPVRLADVNGDDFPDIVAFAADGTEVAFSTGQSFQPKQLLLDNFAEKQGWNISMHFRFVEDLNNDGLADILGNGHYGVYVALSNGEGFDFKKVLEDSYGYYSVGWRVDKNPIVLYDVNRDSLPDIVGFGNSKVYISYNKGGGEFETPEAVNNWFGVSKPGEWSIHDRRFVGDVNGDGLADLVGVSGNGIFVSTSSLK